MEAEINLQFNVKLNQISNIPKELFEKIKLKQNESINWIDDFDLYYELENLINFNQAVEIGEIEIKKITKQ